MKTKNILSNIKKTKSICSFQNYFYIKAVLSALVKSGTAKSIKDAIYIAENRAGFYDFFCAPKGISRNDMRGAIVKIKNETQEKSAHQLLGSRKKDTSVVDRLHKQAFHINRQEKKFNFLTINSPIYYQSSA